MYKEKEEKVEKKVEEIDSTQQAISRFPSVGNKLSGSTCFLAHANRRFGIFSPFFVVFSGGWEEYKRQVKKEKLLNTCPNLVIQLLARFSFVILTYSFALSARAMANAPSSCVQAKGFNK